MKTEVFVNITLTMNKRDLVSIVNWGNITKINASERLLTSLKNSPCSKFEWSTREEEVLGDLRDALSEVGCDG